MRFLLKGCFLWVCFALMAGTAQAQTLDRIVAVVNGEVILYSELRDFVKMTVSANPSMKTDDESMQKELEKEALQQLIRNRLTEQEAKRLKIVVSKQDVDETIASIKRDNRMTDAQFEHTLKEQGKTLDEFKDIVQKEMVRGRLLDRVLKSKTVITDEQVDAAVSNSTDKGGADKRTRLALIYLPVENGPGKSSQEVETRARELLGNLRGGADFAEIAKKYSKGPAAEEGGDIGYISKGDLAADIDSAIHGLKKNDISDIVRVSGGFYIIKVLDIDKGEKKPVDADLRERVRQELYRAELDRKFEEWVREMESRAFIKVSL